MGQRKNKHELGSSCSFCEEKALTLSAELVPIWHRIKIKFPDVHISWAWRNQEMQDFFYSMGKSAAKWPGSRHNRMIDGVPASDAMDLFQMKGDWVARFPMPLYREIYGFCVAEGFPIEWGGLFPTLRDGPHFQIRRVGQGSGA